MALAGNLAASPVEITSQTAPIVYEVKTDIPTPKALIAEQMSADYRKLRDEFSKHEFLEKLTPVIDRKIEEAGATEEFSVVVGTRLEEYDFNRKAFPTGTGTQSFIPLNDYAVRFTNSDAAAYVSVPLEKAKEASVALKNSRRASITYTGSLEKCEEETLNYRPFKVIHLNVKTIKIQLEDGTEFVQDL